MVVTDISDKDGENISATFNRGGCLIWRSNPAKNQLWQSTFKFNIQHPTYEFNIELKLSTSDFGTQHPIFK